MKEVPRFFFLLMEVIGRKIFFETNNRNGICPAEKKKTIAPFKKTGLAAQQGPKVRRFRGHSIKEEKHAVNALTNENKRQSKYRGKER